MTFGLGDHSRRQSRGVYVSEARTRSRRKRQDALCVVARGAPLDTEVRLTMGPEDAFIWIGGELSPIRCYRRPGVYGLAAGIAQRLGKRLVTA